MLSRRYDYAKGVRLQEYRVLNVNTNSSLSANVQDVNIVLRILRDNDEEFLIEYRKYRILDDKIERYIQDYYKDPTYRYLGISKTIILIRYKFIFLNMQ